MPDTDHTPAPARQPEQYLYFSYGSNLSRDKMRTRNAEGKSPIAFDRVWIGHLTDWSLCFDLRGAPPVEPAMGSIRPVQGDEVYGLVYQLKSKECWDKLLESEGITARLHRNGYRVVDVDVVCYTPDRPGEREVKRVKTLTTNPRYAIARRLERFVRPSQRYMNLLISGAEAENLPEEYVRRLRGIDVARRWQRSPLLYIMTLGIPMVFMMRRWNMATIASMISKTGIQLYAKHEEIMVGGDGDKRSVGRWGLLMGVRMGLFLMYFFLVIPTLVVWVFSPRMRAVVKRLNKLLMAKQPAPGEGVQGKAGEKNAQVTQVVKQEAAKGSI